MNTKTILKTDGESEWVELVESSGSGAPVVIDWCGEGRTRKAGQPSADQAMKMAKDTAYAAMKAAEERTQEAAEVAGISAGAQKIMEHSAKGWMLKKNQLGAYRMDGPRRYDGSFSVAKADAEEAITRGVVVA